MMPSVKRSPSRRLERNAAAPPCFSGATSPRQISEILRPVAQQEARPRTALRGAVVAVVEGAPVERQAAAADAAVQQVARPFEHLDLGAQHAADTLADGLPVLARRRPSLRQRCKLGLDF